MCKDNSKILKFYNSNDSKLHISFINHRLCWLYSCRCKLSLPAYTRTCPTPLEQSELVKTCSIVRYYLCVCVGLPQKTGPLATVIQKVLKLMLVTSHRPTADRFSKLFDRMTRQQIYNRLKDIRSRGHALPKLMTNFYRIYYLGEVRAYVQFYSVAYRSIRYDTIR